MGKKTVYVQCRVYHGYTRLSPRDQHNKIEGSSSLEVTFSDHNDGVGMLDRNWFCAESYRPHPLERKKSRGFFFRGCPDQVMVVGKSTGRGGQRSKQNKKPTKGFVYCPEPSSVKRNNVCSSDGCRWDEYSAGGFKGINKLLTAKQLASIKFRGVDADERGVLACMYSVRNYIGGSFLLLGAHQVRVSSDDWKRKYFYKPADAKDFGKMVAYVKQCLSHNRFNCPMLKN